MTASLNPFSFQRDVPFSPVGAAFTVTLGKMLDAGRVIDPQASQKPYIRAANLQDSGLDLNDTKTMPFTPAECELLDLRRGDILVVEGGAVGTCVVLDEDLPGWCFQKTVNRLRPRAGASSRYFAYVLRAYRDAGIIDIVCNKSTIPHLTAEKLRALRIPARPLDEQRAIADYLDRETAWIDMLIGEQQRLIEMLRERRGAVADQLLNPPSHMQPLKRIVADVTVGIVVNPTAWYADEGVPALRGLNIRPELVIADDLVYLTEEGDESHAKSRLRAGDVVMVRTGQAGTAAVIPHGLDGANAIDLLIVRPGPNVDSNFLAAYCNAPSTREKVTHGSVGAIQGHFNVSALRELEFPYIDIAEQRDRARKWSVEAGRIDNLIAETETFMELARERRSALITAAVTGQIDVRGAA